MDKQIIKQANSLSINSQDDFKTAVTLLSNLNHYLDQVIEEKEKVTRPLNEALKVERARFKPLETELETAINAIRLAMSTYQTEQLRLAKIEADKLAKQLSSGKIDFDQAVIENQKIDRTPSKVETEAGSVAFRTSTRLVVTNIEAVPRKYLLIDEKRVLEALREGKRVSGCKLEEVQTVINRRN